MDDDLKGWLNGGAQPYKQPVIPKAAPKDDPPPPSDPGYIEQAVTGVARGAYSNVAGLETAASKIPGLGWVAPSKSTTDWLNRDDAGPVETAARLGGEYGSLMIPGLDLGLGAKFGEKAAAWALEHGPEIETLARAIGPSKAQALVEKIWSGLPKVGQATAQGAIGGATTGDPKGAAAGAATGAATLPVSAASKAAWQAVPSGVRHAAQAGAGVAGYEGARQVMGRGAGSWLPEWYVGHHIPSALASLAAMVLRRPALAGRLGADMELDDEE